VFGIPPILVQDRIPCTLTEVYPALQKSVVILSQKNAEHREHDITRRYRDSFALEELGFVLLFGGAKTNYGAAIICKFSNNYLLISFLPLWV
jgi:hypothetical protein